MQRVFSFHMCICKKKLVTLESGSKNGILVAFAISFSSSILQFNFLSILMSIIYLFLCAAHIYARDERA